jgi:hypothetical protein
MKRLHAALLCSLLYLILFSGCRKDDKPTAKECQVEQFESSRTLAYEELSNVVPYLFKKTFDANGRVNTIDAFVSPFGRASRQQSRLEYKNQMVYILDNSSVDTVMLVWLNNSGRVIKAEEKSGFRYTYPTVPTVYRFTYDSDNRLQEYAVNISSSIPQNYVVKPAYDANGNCTKIQTAEFTYDLTRTAKKQFYFEDTELINSSWLGFKLLEYLNYFPEITSPKNIRINSKIMAGSYVLLNIDLNDHQFDSDGKLISYKQNTMVVPISWNCGNVNPKQ